MDKTSAIKLVQDTFQKPFNKEQFIPFIKNILNKLDESKAFPKVSGAYIKEIFREYVNSYERLGTYTDNEGKHIDVLIVYLQKESTIERARTAQRNFAARYLMDRDEKDAGLIAFVSPNSEDWRFSLVKMDYKFTETASGKVKVKEEFTPAKRFSYLVGENESSHTAQSKLVPFLENDTFNPTLKDLEEAFSIERVTEEFFEKYRALFLFVKEKLDDIVKKDKTIREDFSEKGVDTIDFSKKLMGQIVFLYFLQKKGWFGVEKNSAWGTGPKNFLRLLFEKKVISYKNFFNDVLEPLFYEALATEREQDFYRYFNCKIPFLNGGLFDPINNYDWVHTDILLDDEIFSNSVKTKEGDIGTGILDVFDRYNFTVKEDEPLEKEVAVDPEMLGKVFENLLEVKDRKSKGTYYTPREIVHYMCQESLINYLETELSSVIVGEAKQSHLPIKEDIEILIRYGESAIEHDTRVEQKGIETRDYSYKIPEKIRTCAKLIDEKLANIRVCDPAAGSGAFLVGMMNEIVRARNTLTSYLPEKDSRAIYDFKRHAIHNCLYGVDIDPSAVEIAKLRLWLSLIVDEEDIKQIKPLPNLDYKIMQGNSLLEEYEGIKLFDEKLIIPETEKDKEIQLKNTDALISKIQKEYFDLHGSGKLSKQKKLEIETEIKKQKKL
ncbi:MAG: class I SAM-dependent DNA methyltransferase, partial [Elusimicrobia bacterium]|nr:class I SAM-dependent DNA methyltransferase [Elusimicrobiota bacterium]